MREMEDNYNGDDDQNKGVFRVCTESQSDEGDVVGEEELEQEVLKRRISGHPLYELLMENHINCLKVFPFSFCRVFSFWFWKLLVYDAELN